MEARGEKANPETDAIRALVEALLDRRDADQATAAAS
jgi:hypothetical protein